MEIYTVFKFSNGNELLVYKDKSDGSMRLYYHDYADYVLSEDEDIFICEISDSDMEKLRLIM